MALGRLAADTRHLSPAFASNTKRFVLPTPQAPDKFTYPIERDAQRWTDATKCCSPFTSKTTRESPLISIPGPRDPTEFGFKCVFTFFSHFFLSAEEGHQVPHTLPR